MISAIGTSVKKICSRVCERKRPEPRRADRLVGQERRTQRVLANRPVGGELAPTTGPMSVNTGGANPTTAAGSSSCQAVCGARCA